MLKYRGWLGVLGGCLAGMTAEAARPVVWVGNTHTHDIVRFDGETGAFLGVFIPAGLAGMMSPDDLTLGPDGALYVTAGANDGTPGQGVWRFDAKTGEAHGKFTSHEPGDPPLLRPYGAAFGPDGHLYVASFRSDEIQRFDGRTGRFLDVFARGEGVADGLNGPNDLLFTPAGELLVTTQGSVAAREGTGVIEYRFSSQILAYDLSTGSSRVWAEPGPLAEPRAGYSSLCGLALDGAGTGFYVTDFAHGLLHYHFDGRLLAVVATGGREEASHTGNVAVSGGRLWVPVFEAKRLTGALLRFEEAALPGPQVKEAAVWREGGGHLMRPVGIAVWSGDEVEGVR